MPHKWTEPKNHTREASTDISPLRRFLNEDRTQPWTSFSLARDAVAGPAQIPKVGGTASTCVLPSPERSSEAATNGSASEDRKGELESRQREDERSLTFQHLNRHHIKANSHDKTNALWNSMPSSIGPHQQTTSHSDLLHDQRRDEQRRHKTMAHDLMGFGQMFGCDTTTTKKTLSKKASKSKGA